MDAESDQKKICICVHPFCLLYIYFHQKYSLSKLCSFTARPRAQTAPNTNEWIENTTEYVRRLSEHYLGLV